MPTPTNLVIDSGNTRVKIYVFKEREPAARYTLKKAAAAMLRKILKKHAVSHSILSSVVKEDKTLKAFLKKQTQFISLNHRTPLPVRNLYRTPQTLGNDRIANACGAAFLFPSRNCLVIDVGTCIKYDLVTARGEYPGGAISPGMQMRYRSLHEYTAKLPLVKPARELRLPGTTTKESLSSGVQIGMLNEMNGYVQLFAEKYNDLTVILTGGDAAFFAHLFNFPIFAAPELTAIGLNEILQHNRAKD